MLQIKASIEITITPMDMYAMDHDKYTLFLLLVSSHSLFEKGRRFLYEDLKATLT